MVGSMVERLPFWGQLTSDEQTLVAERSSLRSFDAGQIIGSSGNSCTGIVFIIEGDIRVSLLSEEGKEVTLFRVGCGECCVTTASCVIEQISFDTMVVTARRSSLLVVPASVCAQLARDNVYVKAFMLQVEVKRYSQVVCVLQQMLFKRLDQRVASYVLEHCRVAGTAEVAVTQDELARDINSAREAVTRALRRLAQDGLIEIRRGRIIVRDVDGLARLV